MYDNGLDGTADRDIMEDIYEHLNLAEGALACRDKLDQKISNMASVPRDFKKMILTDDLTDVVNRLERYLEMVAGRGSEGEEAVAAFKRRLRARKDR